ncbi:MAG: hypothetical protein ABIP06_11030 [Pyrinomonadaceae bacterium]
MTMLFSVITIDSNGWAQLITPFMIGVAIAFERYQAWKANRKTEEIARNVISNTTDISVAKAQIDDVHKIVNGGKSSDGVVIAQLSRIIADHTTSPKNEARADAADERVEADKKAISDTATATAKAEHEQKQPKPDPLTPFASKKAP